jgi:hypothetical protein
MATTKNPTSKSKPAGKKRAAKKRPAKASPKPGKLRAKSHGVVNPFTVPLGTLSLNQLIAAGVLNEKSKKKPRGVQFPAYLSDEDITRIAVAVAAQITSDDV